MLADDRPPRSIAIAIGVAMLAFLAVAIVKTPHKPLPARAPAPPPAPAQDGPSPADQLASAIADLEKLPPTQPIPMGKLQEALEDVTGSDKGFKMPDGHDPPPLPKDAPRSIRIGVVLVRYQGAQLAPPTAAAREEALARAKTLQQLAKGDFAAAVRAGDKGSAKDLGRIERGVLEPATQYSVFTLPVGSVSEVLDTPRGFWIVRRIQ